MLCADRQNRFPSQMRRAEFDEFSTLYHTVTDDNAQCRSRKEHACHSDEQRSSRGSALPTRGLSPCHRDKRRHPDPSCRRTQYLQEAKRGYEETSVTLRSETNSPSVLDNIEYPMVAV